MSRIQGVREKVYKGVKYRSTLEANTAETLDRMGIPFVYEGRDITLLEGFRSPFQKNKVIGIKYKPDFEIGNIILECKGFETPEWKIKRKYLFKYLQEKEPNVYFYQTHDCLKDVLLALDSHWSMLGYAVQLTSKETKKSPSRTLLFDSVAQAMDRLNIHKNIGPIVRSLTGEKQWVYGYNWKLIKLKL